MTEVDADGRPRSLSASSTGSNGSTGAASGRRDALKSVDSPGPIVSSTDNTSMDGIRPTVTGDGTSTSVPRQNAWQLGLIWSQLYAGAEEPPPSDHSSFCVVENINDPDSAVWYLSPNNFNGPDRSEWISALRTIANAKIGTRHGSSADAADDPPSKSMFKGVPT